MEGWRNGGVEGGIERGRERRRDGGKEGRRGQYYPPTHNIISYHMYYPPTHNIIGLIIEDEGGSGSSGGG